jgi:antirestriction protein
MKTTTKKIKKGQIFLTDYASYNQGTQFEFGGWVNLDKFNTVEELTDYIKDHFKKADESSPLGDGSKREETMITDFEGFPKFFYSECMNFGPLFEYFEKAEESSHHIEVVNAYANLDHSRLNDLEDFFESLEEFYFGEFSSDVDFAMEIHEETKSKDETRWPYTCIDWKRAAYELMFDYSESEGHYFRNY